MTSIAFLLLGIALAGCDAKRESELPAKTTSAKNENEPEVDLAKLRPEVERFCGACHAVPKAESFPRKAWFKEVEQGYRFYDQSQRSDLHPPPMNQVVAYYQRLAPEELNPVPSADSKSPAGIAFAPVEVPAGSAMKATAVAHVRRLPSIGKGASFAFCDMRTGEVGRVSGPISNIRRTTFATLSHPAHAEPCDLNGDGMPDFVVADLGSFLPADHDKGGVIWLRGRGDGGYERVPLATKLSRVADVRAADFDGDGDQDLIVAEFGWRTTGRILLLRQTGLKEGVPAFETIVIDKRHGTIHVPVADLNRDGRPDFVALISQEHEVIEAFLNLGDGKFERKRIFDAGDPSFGSSGIELVDLDRDGDLDVIYTNGDSFDSFYLKPYHAVHWLENRGGFPFKHHELTRMPGVMRAIAADFDNDGDLDIAAAAYLPEQTLNDAGLKTFDALIWLEQTSKGVFARHRIERAAPGHMALAAGDFDGDGRIDLIAGHHGRGRSITIWRNRATGGGKKAAK